MLYVTSNKTEGNISETFLQPLNPNSDKLYRLLLDLLNKHGSTNHILKCFHHSKQVKVGD